MIPLILNLVKPLNETRIKRSIYVVYTLGFDEQEYFFLIYFLEIIFTIFTMFVIATFDCLLASIIQHCNGLVNNLE